MVVSDKSAPPALLGNTVLKTMGTRLFVICVHICQFFKNYGKKIHVIYIVLYICFYIHYLIKTHSNLWV